MNGWKIGDWIEVVWSTTYHHFPIGSLQIIDSIDDDGMIRIKGEVYWWDPQRFERTLRAIVEQTVAENKTNIDGAE